MAILQTIIVRIRGNTADLNSSLTKTQGIVGRFGTGARKTFGSVGRAAVALGAIGIGAFGVFAGSIAGAVKGLVDYEKELRPAIERSRIGAESLQLLAEAAKRAGSEDGLEAIVDSSQELQLQLGELALTGNARAVEALESLGLAASKLQAMEPEAAFRAVVAELQKIPNVADRAIAAEEIFGGTSEKLSGIVNLTAAEFAALEEEVAATTDIWSGDTLTAAKDFDQELQNIKTDLQRGTNAIVAGLLPSLVDLAGWIRAEGLPAFLEFKDMALAPVKDFITNTLVPAIATAAPAAFAILQTAVIALDLIFFTLKLTAEGLISAVLDPLLVVLGAIGKAVTELAATVTTLVTGAFAELKEAGDGKVLPILNDMLVLFEEELWPLLRDIIIPLWVDFVEKRLTLIKTIYDEAVGPALDLLTKALEIGLAGAIETVGGLFTANTKKMSEDAAALETDTTNPLQGVTDFLTEQFGPAFQEIAEFAMPLIQEAWEDSLKPTFDELVKLIDEVVIPTWIELQPILLDVWEAIKVGVVLVIKLIIVAIETGIGIITGIIRAFSAVLRGDWAAAWQAVQDIGEEYIEGIIGIYSVFGVDLVAIWDTALAAIKGTFSSIFDPIVATINRALNTINNVRNAASSAANAIANLSNIRIPGFAGGVQNFRGGAAIVGERGPELVTLPRGASVTPNGQAGGSTFNISVSANTRSDGRSIARDVRREIRQLKLEGVLA